MRKWQMANNLRGTSNKGPYLAVITDNTQDEILTEYAYKCIPALPNLFTYKYYLHCKVWQTAAWDLSLPHSSGWEFWMCSECPSFCLSVSVLLSVSVSVCLSLCLCLSLSLSQGWFWFSICKYTWQICLKVISTWRCHCVWQGGNMEQNTSLNGMGSMYDTLNTHCSLFLSVSVFLSLSLCLCLSLSTHTHTHTQIIIIMCIRRVIHTAHPIYC